MSNRALGEQFSGRFSGTEGMNHTQRRVSQARAAAPRSNKKKPSRAAAKRQWKKEA